MRERERGGGEKFAVQMLLPKAVDVVKCGINFCLPFLRIHKYWVLHLG